MPFSVLSHCSEIHLFFCFYHLRSDGATDSAVLFRCFRGGILCLLHVSPYIADIKNIVGNPRLDIFLSLPSTSLAVSCRTPLMLSVRTFMSSSKRAVNLSPILASKMLAMSGSFSFSI